MIDFGIQREARSFRLFVLHVFALSGLVFAQPVYSWISAQPQFLVARGVRGLIQALIDAGREVRAAFTDNGWLEVDTVADLELYHRMYEDGRLAEFIDLERAG